MLYFYIGCLAFGALYSIASFLLGGHGFDHSGMDHGGHGGGDSADIPSPFNPLVIASAITVFGAAGLIGKAGFGMGTFPSAILAVLFAAIVGTVMFFGVVKLMYDSQSDSTYSEEDLAGIEAEVITPVPAKGMGEIACVVKGVRYNLTAKTDTGEEITRGRIVRIRSVAGGIALVSPKITIDELDFLKEDRKEDRKETN